MTSIYNHLHKYTNVMFNNNQPYHMCNAKSLAFINKIVEDLIIHVMQLISTQVYNISYKIYFSLRIGIPCTFAKLQKFVDFFLIK